MYSNETVINIIEYIDNNINKKITIDNLVNEFHFNRYYIMKLFKKELNISIVNYINNIRILNSLIQLQTTKDSILKIALDNGFYSQEYYSEIFSKIIGISPQKYRTILKRKNNNKIVNNILKLQELKDNKTKYLQRRKPTTTKVLSVFKSIYK